MASTKATGIDGLSVKLLKLTFNHVGRILHFIFNQSISSGTFVDAWKRARVVPLYKAGDENLVNNYRPVSILPIVSKIIERHVFNFFYEYLSTNKLVTDSQSGFRPSHSCKTALNGLTDKWFKNMDDGKLTGVVFIDLRKTFDTVNHTVLLHKS
jgi:retron-type reverse transcriptase